MTPHSQRYASMRYRQAGTSGLKLPGLSLGLWHNFGQDHSFDAAQQLVFTAFDHGITHFDLANNYGPPPGSAESTLGRMLRCDLKPYRDELLISTKAGYIMGEGPYQDGGSRKYLVSSLDASLRRLGLEYVDVFYHHRPDAGTPLAETMAALDALVRSGKALYIGLSNYPTALFLQASTLLKELGTPCVLHQPKYSLFERSPEQTGLFEALTREGVGSVVFSPLAQGILTDRYLEGIPADSRVATSGVFLKAEHLTATKLTIVKALNEVARQREQSLSQLALSWVLRKQAGHQVTSAIIGASRPEQIIENLGALSAPEFQPEELQRIEQILSGGGFS